MRCKICDKKLSNGELTKRDSTNRSNFLDICGYCLSVSYNAVTEFWDDSIDQSENGIDKIKKI